MRTQRGRRWKRERSHTWEWRDTVCEFGLQLYTINKPLADFGCKRSTCSVNPSLNHLVILTGFVVFVTFALTRPAEDCRPYPKS